ncbi:MAG: hypothetical protein ACLFN1_10885 [Bacteroidales bacterium]
MKVLIKILVAGTLFLVLFIGSCKKQPKCGCDGDVIKELEGFPVHLYYDTINNSAWFQPVSNPMSTYNFCNISEHMDELKKYESGSYMLVSGSVYWECNYLMRASNNPYQSYYKAFMIDVTEVYEDLYGK